MPFFGTKILKQFFFFNSTVVAKHLRIEAKEKTFHEKGERPSLEIHKRERIALETTVRHQLKSVNETYDKKKKRERNI